MTTSTEIAEKHVLPLVLAFAAGVMFMNIASERREARALRMAERAIAVAETYRDHCGERTAPTLAAGAAALPPEGAARPAWGCTAPCEVFDAGRPLIATVTEPQP